LLSDEQQDIARTIHALAPGAILTLARAMEEGSTKEKILAAKLILEHDPLMERPVIRHEVTQKYTADELDKARKIISKMKEKVSEPASIVEPSGLPN
jgi:hypothetical protein